MAIKKRKLIPRTWICVVCNKLHEAGDGYVLLHAGRAVGYHCVGCETPIQVAHHTFGLVRGPFEDRDEMIRKVHG